MKTHRLLKKTIFDKYFSKMTPALRILLFSILSTAAEQNEYLEALTQHSDAIGWHLGKVDILDFILQLNIFFETMLKSLKRRGIMNFLTIAFDETYIPYYGKNTESAWIHGYKNNVKGATGSYKFMVASVVVRNEKFVLCMLPMATCDNSVKLVDEFLTRIRKHFHVSLVLLDRGFASKELAYSMEQQNQQYIALCPKWDNVKKFLEQRLTGICETKIISDHRREKVAKMQYVIEYGLLEHDWVFLTNTNLSGMDLIRAYKARWGIETTFRVMDHADIKSKSTNIVIRTFFFLISLVLYNLWIDKRENSSCTFTQFLDMVALASKTKEQILDEWKKARQEMGKIVDSEQEKDSLCLHIRSCIRPQRSNQGAKAPFSTVSPVAVLVD
jgi:putative transposase